jgi:hypothetical protein
VGGQRVPDRPGPVAARVRLARAASTSPSARSPCGSACVTCRASGPPYTRGVSTGRGCFSSPPASRS